MEPWIIGLALIGLVGVWVYIEIRNVRRTRRWYDERVDRLERLTKEKLEQFRR